ncbi:MAG: hypothetical protein WDW36_008197 [Sanguina aurantia]
MHRHTHVKAEKRCLVSCAPSHTGASARDTGPPTTSARHSRRGMQRCTAPGGLRFWRACAGRDVPVPPDSPQRGRFAGL